MGYKIKYSHETDTTVPTMGALILSHDRLVGREMEVGGGGGGERGGRLERERRGRERGGMEREREPWGERERGREREGRD